MGVKSRRIMIVMAVVFAVALMVAVPVFTVVDTDAEVSDDSAGYSISMTNPNDDDFASYVTYVGGKGKIQNIEDASDIFLRIFNLGGLVPTFTSQSYSLTYAEGAKYTSEQSSEITDVEVSADGIVMEYTFAADGDLIDPDASLNSEYVPAINAIKVLFGDTVGNGDVLKITGKVNTKNASQEELNFVAVNGTHSIYKDGDAQFYYVADIDVTIEFIHSGASVGRIHYRADDRYLADSAVKYDYNGVAYSDLTPLTPCKVLYSTASFDYEAGSARYTVGDTEYRVGHTSTAVEIDTYADVRANTDWNLNDFRTTINGIPAPSADGNVKVDKTYDGAEDAFASTVLDVVGDDLLKIILIAVGVFIGAVVLIIVLVIVLVVVLSKKKKKGQQ